MNNVSPLASGALTLSAAQLVPTVDWALKGFHGAAPANLSALIAGGIVMVLHYGLNYVQTRSAAKAAKVAATDAPAA